MTDFHLQIKAQANELDFYSPDFMMAQPREESLISHIPRVPRNPLLGCRCMIVQRGEANAIVAHNKGSICDVRSVDEHLNAAHVILLKNFTTVRVPLPNLILL